MHKNANSNLRAARSKEVCWKKALVRFKEHQVSECHKIATDYETNLPRSCGNVWEMSSGAAKKTMRSNRICFFKFIEYLQYLARQGQAMQGDTDDESNLIQWHRERPAFSFKMVREEKRQIHFTQYSKWNNCHHIESCQPWSGLAFSLSYATSTQIAVTRNNYNHLHSMLTRS